ncbi:thioredoxin family protein [Shewanella sp. 10N.7]|uniref:thioredoxin family protein n=1 Tax=Shewanella sp. 10N.7 TaxID=2885093 RepID=UPI001E52926E|nr:thioredoxin family protein [Shewanella sp. 10N.7]MCC4831639.1 thioredoxin family protein [Shewanella sp. 10N.7]
MKLGIGFILLSLMLLMGCQSTTHHGEVLPQYTFIAHDNDMERVASAQSTAQANGKLLLVVMGAQWCHDSRGLAAKFSTNQMQTILSDRFETVFVDVGYFNDIHFLPQKYAYPAYFGTPTVMVINPETSQLLNEVNLSKWQSADSVPMDDYLAFFSSIGRQPVAPLHSSAEIDQFTEKNVAKMKQGFDHLRPIWAAVREGNTDKSDELQAVATEVWQFRTQLQKDIVAMKLKLAEDPAAKLNLPDYALFSWQ